jgi:hypothetical protein
MKREKIVERRSGVLHKVEFLMYKENLPYGQNSVQLSQQEHKILKYAHAACIPLVGAIHG